MKIPQVLRYSIDIVSVTVVLGVLSFQLCALFLHWPWYIFVLVLLPVRQLHLVEHNHAHLPLFNNSMLNELLGWMCFLSNGVPLEFYEIHHVRNHHRYNQRFDTEAQDWSSLFGFARTRFPDQPIGRLYYILTFPIITTCHCLIEILRAPGSRLYLRFTRSTAVISLVSAILIWVDFWRFGWFFLVPWVVVFFSLGANNYNHHHGCQMATPFDSANVNLRSHCRSFGFNIGYHVAHHLSPGLHWSKLPDAHESIQSQIPRKNFVGPLFL